MLSIAVFLSLCAAAFAGDTPAPAGPDLLGAFADARPTADFVFVLDTSGALKATADGARGAIADFVAGIPAGDTVEIVANHTRAIDALPPERIDEASRADIVARIRKLDLTSAKDQDQGAALAFVTGQLNRDKANARQFVFFVSNFCNDPSVTSEWNNGGRGCRTIKGLDGIGTAYRAARGDRHVSVTLFPVPASDRPSVALGQGAIFRPGVDAVRDVFGKDAEFVESSVPLADGLKAVAASLDVQRLLPTIRSEAGHAALTMTVEAPPTEDDPTVKLHISSGLKHLGLALGRLTFDGPAAAQPAGPLELQPDGTLDVPLEIGAPPISFVPHEETVELPLTLHADGTLLPTAELAAVGIDTARPGLSATTTVKLTRHYGPAKPVAAVGLAGLVLSTACGLIIVRGRVIPRRLGGTFSWRRGTGQRHVLDVSALPEAAIVIGPNGELSVGPPDRAVLLVRIIRPFWREYAEVEIFANDVEINRKKVPRGRHRIVIGAASFHFGEYRLTWE